jgi:hypothetical protein
MTLRERWVNHGVVGPKYVDYRIMRNGSRDRAVHERTGLSKQREEQRMCVHDLAFKEASISQFLSDYPHASELGRDHPVLQRIDAVPWSDTPGCPPGIPLLIRGLLDETTCKESLRHLGNVLADDTFHLNPAMALALPYLIKLVDEAHTPGRADLVEFLVFHVAEMSLPIGDADPRLVLLLGSDEDRPERARCKAVFVEHAEILRPCLQDLHPDGQSTLLEVITSN